MEFTNFLHAHFGIMLSLSLLVLMSVAAMFFWKRYRALAQWHTKSKIKAVVVVSPTDEALKAVKAAGFNTVALSKGANPVVIERAAKAGLGVILYISAQEVTKITKNRDLYLTQKAIASLPNVIGFHYLDESVPEGYTSADVQRKTSYALRALFPGKLVIFPFRLDPAKTDERYLDEHFVPEATDIITPYFYPVGTTTLGLLKNDDEWASVLTALLLPISVRLASWEMRNLQPGKKHRVMPILQGFEQVTPLLPVGPHFVQIQLEAYRHFWPWLSDLAVFSWDAGHETPKVFAGLSELPSLLAQFREALRSL